MSVTRPYRPVDMIEDVERIFEPALDLIDWVRSSFISDDADLLNEDHAHLRVVHFGSLWTNVPNGRHGRRVIGSAENEIAPGRRAVARQN
jgi:hypothetical protein